ncbi:MAG: SMP-30/gluconolactonase/LRE family protein [Parvularculaceae bacterium]
MKNLMLSPLVALALTGSAFASPPHLEKAWTAAGFDDPEGVAVAPDGALFISNVAGDETGKDGAGWISRVTMSGEVLAARFIDGLDAPKGLAVHNGNLYVADIDQVRIFNAATGEPLDAAAIAGAKFLNDVTVWQDTIFVSDSGTGRIWRMTGASIDLWREGGELAGVNGLLGSSGTLLVSTMTTGSLFEATIEGAWRKIADGMIDADGIGVVAANAGGGFLVSSWPGRIHHVSDDGAVATRIDTTAEGILQNDLTIVGDLVIVPNWEPGTVTAWRVKN